MQQADVLIVGGGLSGLSLARKLNDRGVDFHLAEARDRLGGRILSAPATDAGGSDDRYDLGPAWFWPGQPRMARLVTDLGLPWFEQASVGTLVMQDRDGHVRRDLNMAPMAGSRRIVGGVQRLTDTLAAALPAQALTLNRPLVSITADGKGIIASFRPDDGDGGQAIFAKRIVLTMPPRIAARALRFSPPLDHGILTHMASVTTWMAGQAKLVAIYDRPFWRDAGLSGSGMSHRGPLVEIHDASPLSNTTGALFGFVGVPAHARRGRTEDLKHAAVAQLTAMFGDAASRPDKVMLQDWAQEPFTATSADANGPSHHPRYGSLPPFNPPWDRHLHVASTETGQTFGGYLEGALESAELTFNWLTTAYPARVANSF